MTTPTLTELAARLDRIEAHLGLKRAPAAGSAPAAPTGLTVTIDPNRRPVLTWDAAADADEWDVLDLLDTTNAVKDTVTVPRSLRSPLNPGARRRYAIVARNAAGASPQSAAVDVPPTSTPLPSPPEDGVPASVLDLTRWYLTLPVAAPSGDEDTSGAWDIYQRRLSSFTHPDFFRTGSDDHGRYVEYIAPVKDEESASTPHSGATRCELREMNSLDRDDKAKWSFDDGKTHQLTCTLTCDGTSIDGRREVIVGQIHGPEPTPPLILCVNHKRGGALEVFRQGPRQGDLLTDLQPDELFTYRIRAAHGRLQLWACRGSVDQLPTDPRFDWPASVLEEREELFFKAGAYNKQEIKTATTGRAIVRQYHLDLA